MGEIIPLPDWQPNITDVHIVINDRHQRATMQEHIHTGGNGSLFIYAADLDRAAAALNEYCRGSAGNVERIL